MDSVDLEASKVAVLVVLLLCYAIETVMLLMEPRDGCLRQKMGCLFRSHWVTSKFRRFFFFRQLEIFSSLDCLGLFEQMTTWLVYMTVICVLSIYAKVLIERNHGVSDGFLEEFSLSKKNTSPSPVCKLRNANWKCCVALIVFFHDQHMVRLPRAFWKIQETSALSNLYFPRLDPCKKSDSFQTFTDTCLLQCNHSQIH